MLVNAIGPVSVSFGKKKKDIVVAHDQQKIQKLQQLDDMLRGIIKEIGGIDQYTTFEANLLKAQEKIKRLRVETEEAWGSCPPALKQKLAALDKMDHQLEQIGQAFEEINGSIDKDKPGLIIPGGDKKSGSGGLITDPADVMGAYNSLPKSTDEILRNLNQKTMPKSSGLLTTEELKNSLSEISKPDWSFEKLNSQDAAIYPKLQGQLLIGSYKEIVNNQIELIDKKLSELKEKGGQLIPQTGIKLYSPETTGKIMALETARLRRSTLKESILMPGVIENLDKPDRMLQPVPGAAPEVFKIDKQYMPDKSEVKEILALNKAYKPVLNKLFPDGLNMYIVPGYFEGKTGDMEGGMCIPGHADQGIWLNSYDNESREAYFSMLENQTAVLRDVKLKHPSVLKGNKDRARAVAHEIAHVISYKLMEKDQAAQKSDSDSLILIASPTQGVDFFNAWKMLRTGAKLNGNETHRTETRGLTDADLMNLHKAIDYEMIAEDIRMTVTGDKLPAYSRLTGIFDSTPEGQKQLEKVKSFLTDCLLKDIEPAEALQKHL
jgi:hypothetical protein